MHLRSPRFALVPVLVPVLGLFLALFLAPGATLRAALPVVAVYGAGPNAVDVSVTSDGETTLGLASFISAVAQAHSAGRGGVVDFETGVLNTGSDVLDIDYGPDGAKRLSARSGAGTWRITGPGTDRTAVSGTRYLIKEGERNVVFTFALSDNLTHVGGTLLSRSGTSNNNVTASAVFFDGASTRVATLNFVSSGNNRAGADAFVGFRAPPGFRVIEFKLSLELDSWRSLDDFAFIVAETPPPTPVDRLAERGFLGLALDYAEAMVAQGRDRYGVTHSPVFASMLDRATLSLPAAPPPDLSGVGIRSQDRAWFASNPQHDQALFRLLYALDATLGGTRFAPEADAALAWAFLNTQSSATGLMAWGEHLGWDLRNERTVVQNHDENQTHEFFAQWTLWSEVHRLAPAPALRFAQGLWNNQIDNKTTGDFSRHAKYDRRVTWSGPSFPRHGGHYILAWAHAYARSTPSTSVAGFTRADMLEAIRVVVAGFDARRKPSTDALPAGTDAEYRNIYWMNNDLSYAIEAWEASELLAPFPEASGVVSALRASAARTDAVILGLPHAITGGHGFVNVAYADTLVVGNPRGPSDPIADSHTNDYASGYGNPTHAEVALHMARRHAQTASPGYRALVLAAADRYLAIDPPANLALHPAALAGAIELLLEAKGLAGDAAYLERANALGRRAGTLFFEAGSALPKVTSAHSHYESITGGPDLALALLRLHRANADAGYASWVPWQNFADEAAAQPMADADGDGAKNFLEYALGTRPGLSADQPLLELDAEPLALRLRYPRRAAMGDARVIIETSIDLATWTPLSDEAAGVRRLSTRLDSFGEVEGMEARVPLPPGVARLFARVRADDMAGP